MSVIRQYRLNSADGSAPKGSYENPYTQDEFYGMLDAGTWQGGYVEGYGYVGRGVTVDGSYSGFSFYFDDSWWESIFPWDSWSHWWDDGDEGGSSSNPGSGTSDGGTGDTNDGGSSSGGGNNGNGLSSHTKDIVNEASNFSSSVKRMIDKLMKMGKIIETRDSSIIARWDANRGVMIIGLTAQSSHVLHELTHSLQTEGTHSDREWQAFMLDDIYDALDGPFAQHGEGLDSHTWLNYSILIQECAGKKDDGTPVVSRELVRFLNGLDYEVMVANFVAYWRQTGKNPNYLDGYDSNYKWNWEGILRAMGFEIVNYIKR